MKLVPRLLFVQYDSKRGNKFQNCHMHVPNHVSLGVGNNLVEEHDTARQRQEAPTGSVGDFTAPPSLLEISARAVTTNKVTWQNQNIPRHLEGRCRIIIMSTNCGCFFIFEDTTFLQILFQTFLQYFGRRLVGPLLKIYVPNTYKNHEMTHKNRGCAPTWCIEMNFQINQFLLFNFECLNCK